MEWGTNAMLAYAVLSKGDEGRPFDKCKNCGHRYDEHNPKGSCQVKGCYCDAFTA